MQIVFGRKITSRTPGRFRTRVINHGVEPQLQAHYKHSKVKQYLKEGRALRTETTINDPADFGVGRTLNATSWLALTRIARETNPKGDRAPLLSVLLPLPVRRADQQDPCANSAPASSRATAPGK